MSCNLSVKVQYVKDLSFENPNSPQIFLMISRTPPKINISVDISYITLPVKQESQDDKQHKSTDSKPEVLYEVTLQVNAEARVEDTVAFICELKYCGVFSIEGDDKTELSQQDIRYMLLVSAPSILFPFVRELICRTTNAGWFSPLMLDVVDFKKMYENQVRQNNEQSDAGQDFGKEL
ncbi:MAG: protein-export chaperone SecB [Ehrlichia sp.]